MQKLLKQPQFLFIALLTLAAGTGFTQVTRRTIPLDAPSEMNPAM